MFTQTMESSNVFTKIIAQFPGALVDGSLALTWFTRIERKYYQVKYLKNIISRSGWLSKLSRSEKKKQLSTGVISRVEVRGKAT